MTIEHIKHGLTTKDLEHHDDKYYLHCFVNGWSTAELTEEQAEQFRKNKLDLSSLEWD